MPKQLHNRRAAPPVVRGRCGFTPAVRRGFTLVELLVVIIILAILSSLIATAAFKAIENAKIGRIKTEISVMHTAIEAYKEKAGSYPPDFSDATKIAAHLAKAFPRWNPAIDPAPTNLTPAQALVFWCSGFSSDPQRPISGEPKRVWEGGARTPLFPMDNTRLINATFAANSPVPVYVPQEGQGVPYVYFDNRTYANANAKLDLSSSAQGIAHPYAAAAPPNTWVNPQSFQIISAGLDGNFGGIANTKPIFPTGQGYHAEGFDEDNITNFSNGTLESARP